MNYLEGDRVGATKTDDGLRPNAVKSTTQCSSEYRLDISQKYSLPRISGSQLKELHQRFDELLLGTAGVLEDIRQLASDAGCAVFLANTDGVVLRSYADSVSALEVLQDGLGPGTTLREEIVGTNSIGTCLASREPITIHPGAHVNEALKTFTCSAAPIFGPCGHVVAALGIASKAGTNEIDVTFRAYFAQRAAREISLKLFRREHRNDCIIAFETEKLDPNSLSQPILLALDGDGRVLGATQEGFAALGIRDIESLRERRFCDLFDISLEDLNSVTGQSVRFNRPDGQPAFVTAFVARSNTAALHGMTSIDQRRRRQVVPAKPLDRLTLSDPSMEQIAELCRRVMDRKIPLLLLGETGVGKDFLARAIHAESKRAAKPFIAVNCAAIPATLLASELFGYAPGTFTDGVKGGKSGKILASSGGTLFLDEIGDMPLELQAHLLRVLEDHCVTPLGCAHSLPVDLNVICATHQNLKSLIASEQFRKDLYYRIRGTEVVMPALRDRSNLQPIVDALIEQEAAFAAESPIGVTDGVMTLFRRYTWPGNIRELRSVIRFALALCEKGTQISLAHMPEQLLEFLGTEDNATHLGVICDASSCSRARLDHSAAVAERRRIVEVLRSNSWNVKDAALKLGISRATLYRKMQRYNVEPTDARNLKLSGSGG